MSGNKSHKNLCKRLRRLYRKVSHPGHNAYVPRRIMREKVWQID